MPALDFEGPIEGYVVNHLTRNIWKVQHSMDWDDAMQEARICYLRVCTLYPDVQDAPHFMALFKRVWGTRFIDMARKDSQSRHVVAQSNLSDDDEMPAYEAIGSTDNDGYLSVLIQQAPREVISVVSLLMNAPAEFLAMAAAAWRKSGRNNPEGSKALNRMLGFPENFDSLGAVQKYFED